jgi:uncharacterized protein (DUF433 family)
LREQEQAVGNRKEPIGTRRPVSLACGGFSVTVSLMNNSKTYIRSDQNGSLRVGKTKVSLDSVVYAFQQGHSPETIHQQFPSLSLEEIYGAITYYLANREEVDQYLKRQEQLWDELRKQSVQIADPIVERLRSMARFITAVSLFGISRTNQRNLQDSL